MYWYICLNSPNSSYILIAMSGKRGSFHIAAAKREYNMDVLFTGFAPTAPQRWDGRLGANRPEFTNRIIQH